MLHASQLCVKHVDAFSLCSWSAGEDTTEPHTYDTPCICQPVVDGAQVEGGGGQSGGGEEDGDGIRQRSRCRAFGDYGAS